MILRAGRLMASCFRCGGGELAGAKLYDDGREFSRIPNAKSGPLWPPSAPHIQQTCPQRRRHSAASYAAILSYSYAFFAAPFPLLGRAESACSLASGVVPSAVHEERTQRVGRVEASFALLAAVFLDRPYRR